jgi:hypothetical protein
MKYILFLSLCMISLISRGQKPCEFNTNVTDSIGSYKATKEYIMYERNFSDKSSYIFFSLVNADGNPYLKFQQIEKSAEFIKANCFNASSRLYLQLANGKIITMIHTADEPCSTMIPVSDERKYSRILTGSFYFVKGTMEDLKSSPISLVRVKYASDMADFVVRKELTSELTGEKYQPESYFVNYLKCIE